MNEESDILVVLKRILSRKQLFIKVSIVAFLLSSAIILPVPRYYRCSVTLAPEIGDIMANNSLASVASSFGFNLSSSATGDAIYPEIYPDLINSNTFVATLINKKVTTDDGKLSTTYYEYLSEHQKINPLSIPFAWISKTIRNILSSSRESLPQKEIDFFRLTEKESGIIEKIKNYINCNIDIKNGMIVITVQDQDPLIAATMAENTRKELQNFITNYRTNKARIDYDYYYKLTSSAKQEYEQARLAYGRYADSNMDVYLESYKSKLNDMENDMQIKFNTYNSLNGQLQSAKAKIQEKTPAFTIIKAASVPLRPAGPKRMLFVLAMILVSCIITSIYISKDIIHRIIIRNIR